MPPNYRQQVVDLLQQASGQQNVILTYPGLVEFFDGDHKAAIMLNQILYYTYTLADANGWFYRRHRDWEKDFGFSPYQVRRMIHGDNRVKNPKRNLSDVGLETKVRLTPYGRTATYYRLDIAQFFGMFVQWLEGAYGKLKRSVKKAAKRFFSTAQAIAAATHPTPPANDRPLISRQELLTVQPSDRVTLPWEKGYKIGDTIADVWRIAHNQLKLQFDEASFIRWMQNLKLVDFDLATDRFTLAAHTEYAKDMTSGRFYRNIRRVLSDVYGKEVEFVVTTYHEWNQQLE